MPRCRGGDFNAEACSNWVWCWTCRHWGALLFTCNTAQRTVSTLVVFGLLVWCLTAVCTLLASALKRLAAAAFLLRIRGYVFRAIAHQPTVFFDFVMSGSLVSRIVGDVEAVGRCGCVRDCAHFTHVVTANLVTYELLNRFGDIPTIVGALAYITVLSWKLTLAMFTVAPITALVSRQFGQYYERKVWPD